MKINLTSAVKNFVCASEVEIPEVFNRRIKTGVEDLDAAFGGEGFLPGSSFTLAGQPGAGKTTMLLQILELLANEGRKVAYISGEEAIYQLAFTSKRLGIKKTKLANLTAIEDIGDAIVKYKFDMVILDSLPAMTSRKKLRGKLLEEYLSNYITNLAKEKEVVIGVVLHITKGGQYKGSTLLPHSVDANFMLKRNKEDASVVELEATKNRFGWAGFTAFPITDKGFLFEAVATENEANEESSKSKGRKPTMASQNKDKVMAAVKANGSISMKDAVKLLGDMNKANHTFRELTLTGELTKYGRGPTAVWRVLA